MWFQLASYIATLAIGAGASTVTVAVDPLTEIRRLPSVVGVVVVGVVVVGVVVVGVVVVGVVVVGVVVGVVTVDFVVVVGVVVVSGGVLGVVVVGVVVVGVVTVDFVVVVGALVVGFRVDLPLLFIAECVALCRRGGRWRRFAAFDPWLRARAFGRA
jgi:hypothetical protein